MPSAKFFCIENINKIEDVDTYVDNMIGSLISNGIIPDKTEFIKPYNENDVELDNVYILEFTITNEDADSNWQVVLDFGTFNSIFQLEITISSDDYRLSIEETYFERLKFSIKRIIKSDWQKIVWIKDDDSELLSIELFPFIYRAENLARQLINEVMSKKHGLDWWDKYIPEKIKMKHEGRMRGYKSAVPNFANVDERLMSIDIGDLRDIFSLKKKIWAPRENNIITRYLNKQIELTNEKLKEMLRQQLVDGEDLWKDDFALYLPEEFPERFREFELNRNHVVHNKLIDRSAYSMIKKSIDLVLDDLKTAISKSAKEIMSEEQLIDIQRQKEADQKESELFLLDIMQSESGVNILNIQEILDLFDEKIQEFYECFKEEMRFRQDINIKECKCISDTNGGILFTIEYKITEEKINVNYEVTVLDDSQGATSEISIHFTHNDVDYNFPIRYTNGEVEYNDYQTSYMPVINDEFWFSDLEKLLEGIITFINNDFENMREEVDSSMYSIIKGGGNSPVAEEVFCWECGEEYICIDDNYGTFGQCLNCGELNDICKCSRCNSYFEGTENEDGVNFCDNCADWIKNQ